MAIFINWNDTIGILISNFTNMTGSLFLSLLGIVLFLLIFAMLFKIPLEWTAIFILPLMIVVVAFQPEQFMTILGVIIFYISILFAKMFFLR